MSNPSALPEHHEDHPETISRNARRGLILFVIYLVLYASFVFVNIFSPDTMGNTSVAGISLGGPNLAIVTGMGLIFAAFILALIYMRLTRQATRP